MALDNFRTIELIWDKANKSIIKTIKTASSDTTGRYFSVKVLDEGQEVDLTGAKLQLYWEHPNFNTNGTDDFKTVDTKGKFTLTFSEEMLTNVGELTAYLVLTLTDGKITSDGFPIKVFKGADDGVVVPTNGKGIVDQIDGKIDKGNVTLGDLTQEVKSAMTGGSVAVVGENSVGTSEISNLAVTAEKLADGAITLPKMDLSSPLKGYQFVSGKYNSDGITFSADNTRIAMRDFFPVKKGWVISINDPNFSFSAFLFSSPQNSGFVSTPNLWVTKYTVPQDGYIRVQLSKNDNSNISSLVANAYSFFSVPEALKFVRKENLQDSSVDSSKLQDGSIVPSKLDLAYNVISGLNFTSGSISTTTGADAAGVNRIRSNDYLKVKAGWVIETKDNAFSFGVFQYNDMVSSSFVSSPNAWLKKFKFISDGYVRLTVKLDTDSTDISTHTGSMGDVLEIPQTKEFITDSDMIQNGVIELSHFTPETIVELTSATTSLNEIDLVLFMGQSNMAGRGTASEAPKVEDGEGFEFRAVSDPTKLYPIVEPFGVNENKAGGITEGTKTGSMVSAFANKYYEISNTPIVAVSASKGGSVISEWQPNGAYLTDAISRYHTAENWLAGNGYVIKNKYMVWLQGENDGTSGTNPETYKTQLDTMVKAMTSEGIEHCYLIRIGKYNGSSSSHDEIIEAQTELAKVNKNITLVSTKLASMVSYMKDTQHFNQDGLNILGEDTAINTSFAVRNGKEPVIYDELNNNLYFSYK